MSYTVIEDIFDEEQPFSRPPSLGEGALRGVEKVGQAYGEHRPERAEPQHHHHTTALSIATDAPSCVPTCYNVLSHVRNCPLCQTYFQRDTKLYWLVIVFLVVLIVFLLRR